MLRRRRYGLIHAVEESSFIAMLVGPATRTPHIYDMDSSMADQMADRYRWTHPFRRLLKWMESLPMRRAVAVVPMCEDLAVMAKKYCPGVVEVLRDISLLEDGSIAPAAEDIRASLNLGGPVVMYIGNLEPYQGIGLLLDSFRAVAQQRPDVALVIIGGAESDLRHHQVNTCRKCPRPGATPAQLGGVSLDRKRLAGSDRRRSGRRRAAFKRLDTWRLQSPRPLTLQSSVAARSGAPSHGRRRAVVRRSSSSSRMTSAVERAQTA